MPIHGPVEPLFPSSAALTGDERKAVQDAGALYTLIAERVVAHGPTREDDLAELRALVHGIQRAVLSNAAARLYPGEFRVLGGIVEPHGSGD
jgi:hypothetical protein